MNRAVKWVIIVVAAVVVLAIAALVAVPALVDTPRIQALIANSASHALGRPVKFSSVSIAVFPLPAVVLKNLEVADDPSFGTSPFLRLNEADVRLRLVPLLTGHVELGDFVLKQPVIALIQRADGQWNYASLGGSKEAGAPPRGRSGGSAGAGAVLGSRIRIDKGLVTYESRTPGAAATKYRVENLNVTLTGGGGTGPLTFQGDARVMPGSLNLKITDGSVALNGAKSMAEAPVRARVALDGKQLHELTAAAMGPEPAIAGGINGTLTVDGTVAKPRASGDIQLPNLTVSQTNAQCPEPKRRSLAFQGFKLATTYEDSRLLARPMATTLGKGTITTTMTVTLERGLRVQLGDLAIKGLPLETVLVDYLCEGYAITGPLDLDGALAFNAHDLWHTLSGPGKLRIGPGKVVGARALQLVKTVVQVGSTVSALLSADLPQSLTSAPLDYESITGTYQMTNGVVATRDLLYTSRLMKVGIGGTYGLANGAMNLDMVINHGRGEVKAKVTGTAASPKVSVSPASLLRDVDRGKVEKGLQDLLKQFR